MQTADDASRDGGKVKYSIGVGRESLHQFLQGCLEDGRREVVRLQEYFDKQEFQFEYCPYGDSLDREFTHAIRDDYFEKIPSSSLQSAVVLIDPDNGLEVETVRPGNLQKYIKYSEARTLYQRMSRDSVLVIYQHLPRVKRRRRRIFRNVNSLSL